MWAFLRVVKFLATLGHIGVAGAILFAMLANGWHGEDVLIGLGLIVASLLVATVLLVSRLPDEESYISLWLQVRKARMRKEIAALNK